MRGNLAEDTGQPFIACKDQRLIAATKRTAVRKLVPATSKLE